MSKAIRLLLIGAALGLAASLIYGKAATAKTCQEDNPCWVWSKMGDNNRGIVTKSGKRVVVSPCAYQTLFYGHRIDAKRTPKLKGDAWAIKYGCAQLY